MPKCVCGRFIRPLGFANHRAHCATAKAARAPAVQPATEAEYLRMRSATHDWPACAIFRGGRCTCDAGVTP